MAQLPPKIPTFAPYFHKAPSMTAFIPPATSAATAAAWMDEFLDFSATRRGSHRRSANDSITFLESPETDEFDRLDDDQILSMFCDQIAPSAAETAIASTNASTPSDNNSVNEDKTSAETKEQGDCEEAQSKCVDPAPPGYATSDSPSPPPTAAPALVVDTKRVRRILANRQSAQRSRVRKLQYISELERSVTALQTEVSALSPRVAFFDHQRSILSVGNCHLKQRIAALAQDKLFKDAHHEALKKEIERLRQVYQTQNHETLIGAEVEEDGNDASKGTEAGANHC